MAERTAVLTLRASAALTSSEVASSEIALPPGAIEAQLLATYTRGAAGGYPSLRVEGSPDGVVWYTTHVADSAPTISAPDARLTVYRATYDLASPSDGSAVRYAVPLRLVGFEKIRVQCRERGVPGTPGTLALDLLATVVG